MNKTELEGTWVNEPPPDTKWHHIGVVGDIPVPDAKVLMLAWQQKKIQPYIAICVPQMGWWLAGTGYAMLHPDITLLCWQYIALPSIFTEQA